MTKAGKKVNIIVHLVAFDITGSLSDGILHMDRLGLSGGNFEIIKTLFEYFIFFSPQLHTSAYTIPKLNIALLTAPGKLYLLLTLLKWIFTHNEELLVYQLFD